LVIRRGLGNMFLKNRYRVKFYFGNHKICLFKLTTSVKKNKLVILNPTSSKKFFFYNVIKITYLKHTLLGSNLHNTKNTVKKI